MSDEAIICTFSGGAFDALKSRERRDYNRVKEAVLADGGFSAFDATSTAAIARIFDQLTADPEVEFIGRTYPWIGVRERAHQSEEAS